MHFIDEAQIWVTAGDGGPGIVSFMRAKGRPKLGPDGGSGGHGGDVIIQANRNLNTLSALRFQQKFKAENGEKGGAQNCTGKTGEAMKIPVPLGTLIYHADNGAYIGEVTRDGEELLVAKGGTRGIGNLAFTSSIRRAPDFATAGKKGESFHLRMELKLLADVGLAGFPNAGKSTFLSVVTDARPKIADYPFTTLTPNLGVVNLHPVTNEYDSFVIADIPGLIEGAHQGRGLGDKFLRHMERTKIIVYVVDAFTPELPSAIEQYQILKNELSSYNHSFLAKKISSCSQ